MYTFDSAKKLFTVHCIGKTSNGKPCQAHFTAERKLVASQQAYEAGWACKSKDVHFCPEHKPARAARKVTESKAGKAESKSAPVAKTSTTKSGAKLTVGNRVPAKSAPVATVFAGGQSIGKKARSAKK